MPNWWETEANANPQAAEWQRQVARWRQQLGQTQAQAPRSYPPAAQPTQPQLEPTRPEPTQPAPMELEAASLADIWRNYRQYLQGRGPTGLALPKAAPTKPKYPYQIYLPTSLRLEETGIRGHLGYYPRREEEEEEAEEVPLPPGAPGALWERDVQPTYEERAGELIEGMVPEGRREILEEQWAEMPKWLQDLNRFLELSTQRGLGRLLRAWEHPERRARMGGPVTGLGTPAELEAEEAEEAELEPGKLKLGQFFTRAWEHFRESQEAAPGAHLWEKEGQEAYQRLREAETPEEREGAKATLQELADTKAPYYPWLGKIWEDLTRLGSIPRDIERVAAAGLTLLQEGAYGAEELGTAIEILRRPESRDLTVEQWYPLTTRGFSLFKKQMSETLALDAEMAKEWVAGEISFGDLRQAHAESFESGHVLARAMLDIADGTATAEEIALAYEDLGAELVGQLLVDPLNWGMITTPFVKSMKARHLAQAQAKMLGKVADNPKALKVLEQLQRAVEAGGLRDLRIWEKAARQAGEIPSKTILEQLGDVAKIPFELTPEAKALRDLGEITISVAPVVALADNAEDAIALLRLWADDAAAMRPLIGRIADSMAGKKASIILGAIADQLDVLPSVRAKVWDVRKFWTEVDGMAHEVLRSAYGYTKPNRVQKFFGAYKRLMSEFYLTATYSPGYVTRNAFGDCAAMAIDGLLTFESRQVIDAYLGELGTFTTRRIMTEGRAGREALTGEGAISSMLPGPMGKWSEIGQRITRFAEPGGRLPLGEEARYRRALYKGLKRFFDQNAINMTPDMPELVLVRYGDRAEDLRKMIGMEPSLEVRRKVLEDFIGGAKGKQMSPLRYVDDVDLDAMSPEVAKRLLDEVGKLTSESSPEDLKAAIAKVREIVDEEEARRLAAMEDLPARVHVMTNVDEAEIADDLVDELEDIVARTGDKDLATEVDEIKARVPEIERELDGARASMIDDLKGEPNRDGLEVLMRANSDVEQMRDEWRKLGDILRRDAKAAYDANPKNARAIWGDYFHAMREGWEELAQGRIARYKEAAEQLGRLRRGDSLESILGSTSKSRAQEWLIKSFDVPDVEKPAGYMPGRVLRDKESKKFERLLEWQRTKVDGVRTNAWRAVYGAEPEDYGKALDLLDSADRDIEQFGKATAGRVRELYREAEASAQKMFRIHKDEGMRRLAVDMVWEKYWAARNDTWRRYWGAADERWRIAERDILMDNYARGQRMEPLAGPRPPEEVPVMPRSRVTEGDIDLVKSAAIKDEANWTPEERAAIERWTASGRGVPPADPGVGPAGAPLYSREEFLRDLKQGAELTDEQAQVMTQVLDSIADTWSRHTGRSPESWYTRHFAGLFRGDPPPGALWQGAPQAPRWWYKAEQVVGAKMPERATVEQVRNILTKGGIKKDELQWNGVLRWLDRQEGMVAKEDVLAHLQANRIEFKEFVSGVDPDEMVRLESEAMKLQGEYQEAMDVMADRMAVTGMSPKEVRRATTRALDRASDSEIRAISDEVSEALDASRERLDAWNRAIQARDTARGQKVTKFENYVEPGAVPGSYREIRLALPWEQISEPVSFDEWLKATRMPESMWERPSVRRAYEADLKDPTSIAYGPGGTLHKEPHWSEPNVILHARVNERVGPNGERVLHLEELQSQWQQEARRVGTRPKAWPDNWSIRAPTKDERYIWGTNVNTRTEHLLINNERQIPTDFKILKPRPGAPRDRFELWRGDRSLQDFDTLEEARQAALDSVTMPDGLLAAFDETGQPMAYGFNERDIKADMFQTRPPEAPFAGSWDELGLKRMMRYAAENDYDAITWTTGAMQVDRYSTAARKVFDRLEWAKDEAGFITVRGSRQGKQILETQFGPTGYGSFLGKEVTLEQAVGKNIAAQIANSPISTPGIFEGRDFVVGDRALADIYDRILPYSSNKLTKRWGVQVEDLALTRGRARMPEGWKVNRDSPGTWGLFNELDELVEGGFETVLEAGEAAVRHAGEAAEMTVPGFRLTPQMKRDLLDEGLPLFQKIPHGAKGATDFLADGRAVIRFFESADFSTAVHEVAHVLIGTLPEDDLLLVEKWLGLGDGEFATLHDFFIQSTDVARKGKRVGKEVVYSQEMQTALARYEKVQEQWARGFERYLTTGEAPTPELASAFERMKQWLMDIYHKIVGSSIDIDLSDEVRGVMDRLLAYNPTPRQPVPGEGVRPLFQQMQAPGTNAFNRWFRKSTVLDEAGDPRVLFHGSPNKFRAFKPGPGGLIWLTDQKGYAWGMGDETMALYARIENPIDLTSVGAEGLTSDAFDAAMTEALGKYGIEYGVDVPRCWACDYPDLEVFSWVNDNSAELRAAAQARGHDGIQIAEKYWVGMGAVGPFPSTSYIAFDPNQVKGVANRGTWGTETADLLLQKEPGKLVRAADLPGIGAESLADEALRNLKENGGYTLALDGGSPQGGYAVAIYPNAERIIPEAEIASGDILQYIDDWADVLKRDARAHLGGWVDEGQAYLDLSAVVDDLDEAMIIGWENKQKALFDLGTFEDVPVTEEAASEAARRLGKTLQRPTGLQQAGPKAQQMGFWNIDPQNWRQYTDAINQPGASAGPLPHDILQRSTGATRRALDKVEEGMTRDWNSWQGLAADDEVAGALRGWFDDEVVPSYFEQRATAYDYATSQANHALLDYGNRRSFDTWLNYVVPYHYWFTRAGKNWARRLASRPGMLSSYTRIRDAMELANENAGRRQRFQHMIKMPFPWLPGWMGDSIYVDPSALIAPFSQIFYTDWNDADSSKQGLTKVYDTARSFGLRPYHVWEYLYQMGAFAKAGEFVGMDPEQAQEMLGPEYPQNFGNVLPQTNLIRALTAILREQGVEAMPPGGINIEAPFRRLAGLPTGEIWDPYRINRMLGNLSAEEPHNMQLAQATLRAQELVARDSKANQTGKVWSASSEIAQKTAEELGWTPEQLQEAQDVLATAMQRSTLERSIGTLGWLTGPRMSIEPTGERAQLEMAAEARTKTWSPERPGGSREAYESFKQRHPAMYPRATQYEVMPGEKEYEAMPPGYRANWLNLRYQKELLHDAYDQAVDNLLRAEPWNWEGRGAIENQRRQALAAVEAKYPMPEMENDIPAVLYGMNPEEMWNSTVEKALYAMQASKPSPGAFEGNEGVDWDAYYTEIRKWQAMLPKAFDFGIPKGGLYNGMDPKTAMDQFEKRYDSPLEAAYEAYQTEVAEPAWAAYNKAKADEERLWPGMKALQTRYWELDKEGRRALLRENPDLKSYWDWKDRQGGTPYNRIIGQVEAMPAAALIPAILKLYPTREWTEEQLKQELQGVVFPALAVQQDLKREQRGEAAWGGTAAAAPGAGGGAAYGAGYPQYSAAELNYLKNQILRRWNARQGKGGGYRSGGYGGGYRRGGYYSAQRGGEEDWRPAPFEHGGPFYGVPGAIRGGPFRG